MVTDIQGTHMHVRCHPSGAMFHTFDITKPAVTHISTHSSTKNKWSTVRITEITKALREAVSLSGLQVGFQPKYVNVCSIHSGRAMALILDKVNTNKIRLLGRWNSNTVMC